MAITAYAESMAVSTPPSSSQCGLSELKLSVMLQDHKIRKSGLNSESQAYRHAYMSTLGAKSESETSIIKKLFYSYNTITKTDALHTALKKVLRQRRKTDTHQV